MIIEKLRNLRGESQLDRMAANGKTIYFLSPLLLFLLVESNFINLGPRATGQHRLEAIDEEKKFNREIQDEATTTILEANRQGKQAACKCTGEKKRFGSFSFFFLTLNFKNWSQNFRPIFRQFEGFLGYFLVASLSLEINRHSLLVNSILSHQIRAQHPMLLIILLCILHSTSFTRLRLSLGEHRPRITKALCVGTESLRAERFMCWTHQCENTSIHTHTRTDTC